MYIGFYRLLNGEKHQTYHHSKLHCVLVIRTWIVLTQTYIKTNNLNEAYLKITFPKIECKYEYIGTHFILFLIFRPLYMLTTVYRSQGQHIRLLSPSQR